jgi:carbamate kinase
MLPKVQAALDFVRSAPDRRAIITSPDAAEAALRSQGGTEISLQRTQATR